MLMISTSPITEHSATSSSGPRGMTYDPYLGSSSGGNTDSGASRGGAKVPEFLRPLPKPARYNNNGETCTPLLATTYPTPPVRINGIRPSNNQQISRIQQQQPNQTKYLPTRPILEEAVNLVHKRDYNGVQDDYNSQQQRLYVPNSSITSASAYTVSQSHPPPPPSHSISSQQNTTQYTPSVSHYYTQPNSVTAPIVTHQYTTGPLYFNNTIQQQQQRNSQQQYTLSTTTNVSNSTISPHHTYIHIPNNINNNNNIINNTSSTSSYSPPKPGQSILKDTISKPIVATTFTNHQQQQLLLQQQHHHQQQQQQQKLIPFKVPSGKEGSLKHRILTRPPGSTDSPNKRKAHNGPLHPSGTHFARGSLIQLANGELRKIEDMRTEDFISSAEKCPALRLDPSTVVRILENSQRPQEVLITLSYGRQGTQQVELEVSLEHPFFVYGKGWASISPERTLLNFDLPCHRLSVGDICISLSPRPSLPPPPPTGPAKLAADRLAHHQATVAAAAAAELLRKRRWSAPDQFCSDDENEGPTPSQRTKDTTTGF